MKLMLGDIENILLRELWKAKNPLSVKEFSLQTTDASRISPTEAAAILDRLYKRGIVCRILVNEGGLHYVYSLKLTEEKYEESYRE
jgi:predicted transcriptional regulator